MSGIWRRAARIVREPATEKSSGLRGRAEELHGNGPEPHEIGTIWQVHHSHPAQRHLYLSHSLYRAPRNHSVHSLQVSTRYPTRDPLLRHVAEFQQESMALGVPGSVMYIEFSSVGDVNVDLRSRNMELPDDLYYTVGRCMLRYHSGLERVNIVVPEGEKEHRAMDGRFILRSMLGSN